MAQVFQARYFVVITILFISCASLHNSAMALDLSKLYGHVQVKRNGEFIIEKVFKKYSNNENFFQNK